MSTMSIMHCLKNGSSCLLPCSSSASRPFFRAIWARFTSCSMMGVSQKKEQNEIISPLPGAERNVSMLL